MKQQPIDAWLDDAALTAARRWATNAVQTNRARPRPTNAVYHFCHRHSIVLDLFQPRVTGRAILRTLALIDNAREVAP